MAITITTQLKYKQNGIEYGTLKVFIPHADVLTLNSASVAARTLVEGVSGKIITLTENPLYVLTFAGAAFATNVSMRITNENTGIFPLAAIDIDGVASDILQMTITPQTSGPQFVSGDPLTVKVITGNPTGGGTSTITIYLAYKVITL